MSLSYFVFNIADKSFSQWQNVKFDNSQFPKVGNISLEL